MSNLSKCICLVHKLRKLTSTKELFHRCYDRAYIDQSIRRRLSRLLDAHTLLNNTFHTQQANTELRLNQLTNAAHTTIPQVVDIVFASITIVQSNQTTNNID